MSKFDPLTRTIYLDGKCLVQGCNRKVAKSEHLSLTCPYHRAQMKKSAICAIQL